MMECSLLEATRRELVSSWGVEIPDLDDPRTAYEILLHALEERILYLLQHNSRKLTNALYVLDVSELRYAQALDQPTMKDRARDLAHAVLERETEKIKVRQRYAANPDDLPDTR